LVEEAGWHQNRSDIEGGFNQIPKATQDPFYEIHSDGEVVVIWTDMGRDKLNE
jgi:hypothetical protein